MSDQPKPTTGEWTFDTDIAGLIGDEPLGNQWKIICDAHNAALADEREKFDALACGQFDLERLAMDKQEEIKQLREQLAAAQAAIERCFNFNASADKSEILELLSKTLHRDTTALAAAIAAAQQPLVDALRGMIYAFHKEAVVIGDVNKQERALESARFAIAKVKEGK